MQIRSLGWEDPSGGGHATHSIFLPGEPCGQRSLEEEATVHRVAQSQTRLKRLSTHMGLRGDGFSFFSR